MMKENCILVRYGELALKGKNRSDFEDRLIRNIREALASFSGIQVKKTFGRIFVELGDEDPKPVVKRLKDVFGIVGISPARRIPAEIKEIEKAVLALVQEAAPRTFKVVAKRVNTSFPMGSQEINRHLGGFILKNVPGIKVDVHNPELTLHVEVRGQKAYVYGNDQAGLGGLPVGASGRVMLLLSGGIDSPVAGYLALKRGVELEAIHFHSYPFTSERAQQKVEDLGKILTRYGGKIRLHLVPFTEIQTEISQKCLDSYSITIMRRMMLRIAEKISEKQGALALVTGESLGQVASQTLESMRVINEVTKMPILRPLVGMDKQEIMVLAKQIGTYETSILPYEDCCTVFLPRNPKTRPNPTVTVKNESQLAVEELVERAVAGTEVKILSEKQEEEFSFF